MAGTSLAEFPLSHETSTNRELTASETGQATEVDLLVAQAQDAEHAGRWPLARERYESALHLPRSALDHATAASLLRWIARTHLMEGAFELADEVARVGLHTGEEAADTGAVAAANNLLGIIAHERGDLDQAELLYARARALAEAAGDRLLVAMAEQNAGIIANVRGEFRTALKRYRSSLARHRSLGRSQHLARALNNLGMLCTDLRRWRAADRAFAEALEVCAELGDVAGSARIAGNRIEPLIARRRWGAALAACAHAREMAGAAGETETLGVIAKHLGVIARETGDRDAAAAHFAEAGRIARERGDVVLEAEAAWEEALLHWARQAHRETLHALNRAHKLFSRIEARRDLAEVDARLSGLEARFVEIVAQWGQSIESADRYTQGHCERVARYACALARAAGIEDEVLLWFRMGALLHDVGKIVVPPEILNKPGALTPQERAQIEQHADAGVELLGDVEFPWDIRPMVRHHHEAWDGSGYPVGLAGEEIPLAARILCVADVYDALASDRPYRRAFTHERTLEIMAEDAGRKLDPGLFAIFRQLDLDALGIALRVPVAA